MKINKSQLSKIIKEELSNTLDESMMDRFKNIFRKKEDPDNITQFVSKKEREELLLPKEVDAIFDMFADFVDEAPERNKAKFLSRFKEVEELSQTIDDILGRNKREDLKGPNKGADFQAFMSNSKNFRNEDKEDGDFKRYHYLNKEARLNADAHGFFSKPLNPFWQQDFFGPGDAQGNYSGFEEYSRGPQAGEKEEKKLSAVERGKRRGLHVVKENRMKIRKSRLSKIIQEELQKVLLLESDSNLRKLRELIYEPSEDNWVELLSLLQNMKEEGSSDYTVAIDTIAGHLSDWSPEERAYPDYEHSIRDQPIKAKGLGEIAIEWAKKFERAMRKLSGDPKPTGLGDRLLSELEDVRKIYQEILEKQEELEEKQEPTNEN
jgi:hypothetical protein